MLALVPLCSAFAPGLSVAPRAPRTAVHRAPVPEASLGIDLKGKVAFVAGVADSAGYGWAIVKALSEAGATVAVGTWPPVLAIFEKSLKAVRRAVATALQFLADTPRNSFRRRESLTRT